MLAQNFKAAADLGLTEWAHAALIKTLAMFERGEVVHAPRGAKVPNGFNIGETQRQDECGTVACIAGWAAILAGRDAVCGFEILGIGTSQKKNFGALIMPPNWFAGKYTVEQAAGALRNYLTTGEPRWSDVLA